MDSGASYSVILGIFYHSIGALAASTFYIPIKFIKNWSWEVSWIINGIGSWLIMPILVAFLLIHDLSGFYVQIPSDVLFKTYIFGALWGMGGLTFGLTLRYLGISLGYGVAIGITLIVGTMLPPILNLTIFNLIASTKGVIAIFGVFVALLGVIIVSIAGHKKELETNVKNEEFNVKKGLLIAVFCGITSSFMAFAIEAGQPIQDLALKVGVDPLYQIVPSYVFIMLGGLTTNAIYCVYMMMRNDSFSDVLRPNFTKNTILALLAGTIWYLQFFFYGWGHVQMVGVGIGFVSWTLHMSLLVLFGSIAGVLLKEWVEATRKSLNTLTVGILSIIVSTMIIGLGGS